MSQSNQLDQIQYCERCGISFLWTAEEQKAEQAQNHRQDKDNSSAKGTRPSHCPGCRYLLPAAGRERGLVKWYNRRKRYGFLVRRDHPEIFAHGSAIADANALRPGDLVEFSVVTSERGLAASEITVLEHGDPPIAD